jgi:glyoxylase-like metal-dependent hydrolase (beta-lactamase superfamily II)
MDSEPLNKIDSWFEVKSVDDRVWCISDHSNDNIYLVAGDDKALLIDTGIGVADLAQFVKTITTLPLTVVNTHGHPDHAGGNFQFSKVYAHPLDFELIKHFTSQEFHKNTIQRVLKENADLASFILKDIRTYELPSIEPVQAGDVFDLGNRKLEVIETPGHTKGSIVLLDAGNRMLFTGDNNNTLVWLFLDGCLPIESYLQTLQKLNQRNAEFETILPGHGDPIEKSFIDEQIACAQNIISGECKGEEYKSFAGSALLCKHKRAGIAFNPDNIFIKK